MELEPTGQARPIGGSATKRNSHLPRPRSTIILRNNNETIPRPIASSSRHTQRQASVLGGYPTITSFHHTSQRPPARGVQAPATTSKIPVSPVTRRHSPRRPIALKLQATEQPKRTVSRDAQPTERKIKRMSYRPSTTTSRSITSPFPAETSSITPQHDGLYDPFLPVPVTEASDAIQIGEQTLTSPLRPSPLGTKRSYSSANGPSRNSSKLPTPIQSRQDRVAPVARVSSVKAEPRVKSQKPMLEGRKPKRPTVSPGSRDRIPTPFKTVNRIPRTSGAHRDPLPQVDIPTVFQINNESNTPQQPSLNEDATMEESFFSTTVDRESFRNERIAAGLSDTRGMGPPSPALPRPPFAAAYVPEESPDRQTILFRPASPKDTAPAETPRNMSVKQRDDGDTVEGLMQKVASLEKSLERVTKERDDAIRNKAEFEREMREQKQRDFARFQEKVLEAETAFSKMFESFKEVMEVPRESGREVSMAREVQKQVLNAV